MEQNLGWTSLGKSFEMVVQMIFVSYLVDSRYVSRNGKQLFEVRNFKITDANTPGYKKSITVAISKKGKSQNEDGETILC